MMNQNCCGLAQSCLFTWPMASLERTSHLTGWRKSLRKDSHNSRHSISRWPGCLAHPPVRQTWEAVFRATACQRLHTLDEQLSLPSQLTIAHVSNGEMLKTWLRIMIVGSEIPEEGLTLLLDVATKQGFKHDATVHYYLGMLGNRPVATSLLYLAGGVAGIYNVATLPEVRQRGIGSALTVAPLLDARAWGYRIGTLQSTPMGLNLYRRLGFREYCTFHAYFWQGEE